MVKRSSAGKSVGEASTASDDDQETVLCTSRRSSSRNKAAEPKPTKTIIYKEMELTSSDEEAPKEVEKEPIKGRGKRASAAKANESFKELKPDSEEEDSDEENVKNKKGKGRKSNGSSAKKPAPRQSRPGPASSKTKGKKAATESDEDFEDEDEEEHVDEGSSEESDGEDENIPREEPINYKDEDWYFATSKICQNCNKKYETCRDASNCLTGNHKRIRCYVCFTYWRNTDRLFDHYDKEHRKEGTKAETILCNLCDQPLPFKSVSCHMITNHVAPHEDPKFLVRNEGGEVEDLENESMDNSQNDEEDEEEEEEDEDSEEADEEEPPPKRGRSTSSRNSSRSKKRSNSYEDEEDEEEEEENDE